MPDPFRIRVSEEGIEAPEWLPDWMKSPRKRNQNVVEPLPIDEEEKTTRAYRYDEDLPAVRKKRNPLLVEPLPLMEDEDIGGMGQMGDIPGLPDELQPSYFYRAISHQFPYAIYQAQLKDWWIDKFARIPNPQGIHHKDKDGEPVTNLEVAQLEMAKQMEQIALLIGIGYPVETLPQYATISKVIGPNVQRTYENYTQDYLDEQGQLETERFISSQKLTGDLAKRYGPQAAEAILRGMGRQEDFERFYSDQARQKAGDQYAMQSPQTRRDLVDAVKKGWITAEEAFGTPGEVARGPFGEETATRTQIARSRGATREAPLGVDEYGQPIQSENAWERWQHGQAAQERQQQSRTWAGDKVGILGMMEEARKLGMQVDPDSPIWKQVLDPSMPMETQAMYAMAFYKQIQDVRVKQQEDYGGWLTRDYPDIYKSWQEKNLEVGYPASVSPTRFLQWTGRDEEGVENVEWQKAYTAKEAQRWGEYGDIYPAYRSYAKKNYAKAKPFEEWMTIDPQAMAWTENVYKKRKREQEEQARRRLAPAGVLR